jgi:hypothetical protein
MGIMCKESGLDFMRFLSEENRNLDYLSKYLREQVPTNHGSLPSRRRSTLLSSAGERGYGLACPLKLEATHLPGTHETINIVAAKALVHLFVA